MCQNWSSAHISNIWRNWSIQLDNLDLCYLNYKLNWCNWPLTDAEQTAIKRCSHAKIIFVNVKHVTHAQEICTSRQQVHSWLSPKWIDSNQFHIDSNCKLYKANQQTRETYQRILAVDVTRLLSSERKMHKRYRNCTVSAVAALHQGAPGQMTGLKDPPPWLKPCVLLCFGNSVNRKWKCYHIWPLCFILTVKWRWRSVYWGRQLKKSQLFLRIKVHPGDLAGGFSDLEMTWLLYCAGAATVCQEMQTQV